MLNFLRVISVFALVSSARADINVDVDTIKDPKNMVIEITIDECISYFKVPKTQWSSFSNNNQAMDKLVQLARDRAASGCK
jgi:hypothetical protein